MSSLKYYDFLATYSMEKAFLGWIGVYPNTTKMALIFYLRCCITLVMLILLFLSMGYFVLQNLNDTMIITETFFLCLSVLSSLIKMVNFLINNKSFTHLEKYISSGIIKKSTIKNKQIIKQGVEKTIKIMNIYKLVVLLTIIGYFATPLFISKENDRLPISTYYPWNVQKKLNLVLSYISQLSLLSMAAFLNTSTDIVFAIISSIVSSELQILKNNLMNMDYSPLNKNVRFELRKNILLHKEILKIVNAIENLFKYSMLGQFSISIIVICFSVFHVSSVLDDEKTDALKKMSYLTGCMGYLVCMILEVSTYCIYGHDVMAESSDINQAIYLSNWYAADVKVRKDLIIFRECVKKPVLLKAGNLVPLSVETLVKIFRLSYSFFAVLQHMN